MFERRLKIFLTLLIVCTGILILRAMQVQIWERRDWQLRAANKLSRLITIPTTRGRILECTGRELAVDFLSGLLFGRQVLDSGECWPGILAQPP